MERNVIVSSYFFTLQRRKKSVSYPYGIYMLAFTEQKRLMTTLRSTFQMTPLKSY